MGKKLFLGLAILAVLAPLSATQAAGMDGKDIERIVADLESVIGRIEGVDFEALTIIDHGNGVRGVGIPLPEATRERLLAKSASESLAKDFKVMAAGLQLTEPSSPSVAITAALAIEDTLYNFWWVTGNLRPTDQVKRTTFQLKGPGDKFRIVDNFLYPARTVFLWFVEESSGGTGFHTILAKVAGGGKAKTIFFAQ